MSKQIRGSCEFLHEQMCMCRSYLRYDLGDTIHFQNFEESIGTLLLNSGASDHPQIVFNPLSGPDDTYLADPRAHRLAFVHDCSALSGVVEVASEEDVDVEGLVGEQAKGLVRKAREVEAGALGAEEVGVVHHLGIGIANAANPELHTIN